MDAHGHGETNAGVDSAGTDPSTPDTRAWPLWQRVGFRFLLLYFFLYAALDLVRSLLSPVSSLLAYLGDKYDFAGADGAPAAWLAYCAAKLGSIESGFQGVTTWLDRHGLTPYEVIHQRTGSGDTGHDIAKMMVIATTAALVAAVWSVLRRRSRGYPRLGRWLHLAARFWLAFTLVGYGLAKFYGGQFGELRLDRLTQQIGDTWPMTMVGTFMQASRPYELFGGAGEVLGGLLLFHHRTALLGALVSIAVMTNVCALNWLCGVPVKLFSSHLLFTAVLLLLPYRHNLWALFIRNRPTTPVDMSLRAPRFVRWLLLLIGFAWVLGTLAMTHIQGTQPRPWMQGFEKSELYGVWTIETLLRDGQEVPLSDATRWRFLAIDRGTVAWTQDAMGQKQYLRFKWDPASGVAQVASMKQEGHEETSPWTCEQGSKTVQADPPLLLRNEDRGRLVDGDRRTLVLKGTWNDEPIELHCVEKRFRLQTGFRFRQELPDFW